MSGPLQRWSARRAEWRPPEEMPGQAPPPESPPAPAETPPVEPNEVPEPAPERRETPPSDAGTRMPGRGRGKLHGASFARASRELDVER